MKIGMLYLKSSYFYDMAHCVQLSMCGVVRANCALALRLEYQMLCNWKMARSFDLEMDFFGRTD